MDQRIERELNQGTSHLEDICNIQEHNDSSNMPIYNIPYNQTKHQCNNSGEDASSKIGETSTTCGAHTEGNDNKSPDQPLPGKEVLRLMQEGQYSHAERSCRSSKSKNTLIRCQNSRNVSKYVAASFPSISWWKVFRVNQPLGLVS